MRLSCLVLLLGLLGLLSGQAAAADAPAPAKAAPRAAPTPSPAPKTPAASEATGEPTRRPAEILPAPLDNVACNVLDLEKSGHLAVTKVVTGWSEDFGDEALIWTVKVLKPMTCRHATLLLRRYRDVRFYHAEEKSEKELFSGVLYFSPRIAESAVHGDILQPDTEFEVWLPLTTPQAMMLARQDADHLIFHEPQTRRVSPLGVRSTQWNLATSKIPRWFTKQQESDRRP
jgi:hypothetical protein